MKTKEEIDNAISRISKRFVHDEFEDNVFKAIILSIIKEELSKLESLHPYKIDEERMENIYNKERITNISYPNSIIRMYVDKYNSTLPEIKQLEPLPSEMPKDILEKFKNDINYFVDDLWEEIYSKYGTPAKKELPSVEELESEISGLRVIELYTSKQLAQHLVNKYSLPKREWWMDLKRGDKFMYDGFKETFTHLEQEVKLFTLKGGYCLASFCTPYIEPELKADDVISKHNLTEQEIKAIREGGR